MAMYNLGKMLIEENIDKKEGKKYLEMSAKRGYENAKKYLNMLGED